LDQLTSQATTTVSPYAIPAWRYNPLLYELRQQWLSGTEDVPETLETPQDEQERLGMTDEAYRLYSDIKTAHGRGWDELSRPNRQIFDGITDQLGAPQIEVKDVPQILATESHPYWSDWDEVPAKDRPVGTRITYKHFGGRKIEVKREHIFREKSRPSPYRRRVGGAHHKRRYFSGPAETS